MGCPSVPQALMQQMFYQDSWSSALHGHWGHKGDEATRPAPKSIEPGVRQTAGPHISVLGEGLGQERQPFSVKSYVTNISVFIGQIISVPITQLCCNVQAA